MLRQNNRSDRQQQSENKRKVLNVRYRTQVEPEMQNIKRPVETIINRGKRLPPILWSTNLSKKKINLAERGWYSLYARHYYLR